MSVKSLTLKLDIQSQNLNVVNSFGPCCVLNVKSQLEFPFE